MCVHLADSDRTFSYHLPAGQCDIDFGRAADQILEAKKGRK